MRTRSFLMMHATHPTDAEEPILQSNKQRFVLFPIKHPRVWEMYKKAEASFWTAEEIDLAVSQPPWALAAAAAWHACLSPRRSRVGTPERVSPDLHRGRHLSAHTDRANGCACVPCLSHSTTRPTGRN